MFATIGLVNHANPEVGAIFNEFWVREVRNAFSHSKYKLKRAKGIKDDELKIEKETDERVEATIREYHIVIDFEARTILYDCAD